jgi:hypothetical protein
MTSYSLDTPYSSQIIFLNSKNAIYKTIDGEGSYIFNLQTPVQLPTNCRMLLSITDAQIPNVSPNVNSTNNRISFSVPTFSKFFTIVVDDGDGDRIYSADEFINTINEKILANAGDQFVLYGVYQPNTAKVKWFCDFPFEIINTINYPTTCIDLLGFKKDNNNNAVQDGNALLTSTSNPSFHITMPSCVNFTGTPFIFVKFKNISVNNLNSNGIMDEAVVRIDNNVPYGYMIFYRPVEVQRFIVGKQTISNISFILTDTQGNPLNIFSNDAQITIKIEYIYKAEMRSVEEGTINYELRKLAKIAKENSELTGVYNPETNTFFRD